MNLEFTEAELAFQREVRAWFAQAVPASLKKRAANGEMPDKTGQHDWERILGAKGWLGQKRNEKPRATFFDFPAVGMVGS